MNPWEIKMLYDGTCPICHAEVAWLSKWNRQGRLAFEDVTASPTTTSY
jgi:predicted DCC family thiol-disulfide oxidoreductase YuxK